MNDYAQIRRRRERPTVYQDFPVSERTLTA